MDARYCWAIGSIIYSKNQFPPCKFFNCPAFAGDQKYKSGDDGEDINIAETLN